MTELTARKRGSDPQDGETQISSGAEARVDCVLTVAALEAPFVLPQGKGKQDELKPPRPKDGDFSRLLEVLVWD
jgi:hypothetical protein